VAASHEQKRFPNVKCQNPIHQIVQIQGSSTKLKTSFTKEISHSNRKFLVISPIEAKPKEINSDIHSDMTRWAIYTEQKQTINQECCELPRKGGQNIIQ